MASPDVVASLADAVSKTLLPGQAERHAAEQFLNSQQASLHFPSAMLQLVAAESASIPVRQAAAVYLKNYTSRLYAQADVANLPAPPRDALKHGVVAVVLAAPVAVRRQLSAVLAVIAQHEYPTTWPSVVEQLNAPLDAAIAAAQAAATQGADAAAAINWVTLQGALESLAAIFERYPNQMRSNELYTEINLSLRHTAPRLLKILPVSSRIVRTGLAQRDASAIELIVGNAQLLARIFYLLSWQDMPAFFEDNLKQFMELLRELLTFEDGAIDEAADDDPSCIDHMHAAIIEILNLYAGKFDEDFRPYLQFFIRDVWELLVRRSNSTKYDKVVTTGIKFLSTVARSPDHVLFNDPAALTQICNSIVIPNIQLREDDKELFEDNAVEYIRLDMEGSDSGTRRRGAVELVKGLCNHFEARVTEIFSGHVSKMLEPSSSWEDRDAALYIVTALSWKSGTAAHGATETSSLINVVDFFNTQVLPELEKSASCAQSLQAPIFTADLIKYVISFRVQIPKSSYGNLILLCVKLFAAKEPVVRTYAAACIERLLTVKDLVPATSAHPNGVAPPKTVRVPRMTKEDLQPVLESLLPAIVSALQNSARADEYMMRLILRFCSVAQEKMRPYTERLIGALVQVLGVVIKNPANPLFNHYLFEALSALIRFNGDTNTIGVFESALHPLMQKILVDDVTEFAPYVFQVMSQMMNVHASNLPALYTNMIPPLLDPSMWDRKGYIPSMVQYLEVYIRKNHAGILAAHQMEPILGVFNKLVASKATDHLGLRLLCTIFESYEAAAVTGFCSAILSVLLVRLSAAKTAKYVQSLIYCLSVFVLRYGAEALKAGMDSQQQHLLHLLLQQVWLREVASIVRPGERRVCAIALADIACASDMCCEEPYLSRWPEIITATVALTEGAVVDDGCGEGIGADEENAAHLGAGESYSAAHSQLQWGLNFKNRPNSIRAGVDPKQHLANSIAQLSRRHPSRFGAIIERAVNADAKRALQTYMSGVGATVA